jgi:hypothetical protein
MPKERRAKDFAHATNRDAVKHISLLDKLVRAIQRDSRVCDPKRLHEARVVLDGLDNVLVPHTNAEEESEEECAVASEVAPDEKYAVVNTNDSDEEYVVECTDEDVEEHDIPDDYWEDLRCELKELKREAMQTLPTQYPWESLLIWNVRRVHTNLKQSIRRNHSRWSVDE